MKRKSCGYSVYYVKMERLDNMRCSKALRPLSKVPWEYYEQFPEHWKVSPMTWLYVYSIIVTAALIWFAVWGCLLARQHLQILNGLCKVEVDRWLEVRDILRKVRAKPTHARLLAMMKRCGMLE